MLFKLFSGSYYCSLNCCLTDLDYMIRQRFQLNLTVLTSVFSSFCLTVRWTHTVQAVLLLLYSSVRYEDLCFPERTIKQVQFA